MDTASFLSFLQLGRGLAELPNLSDFARRHGLPKRTIERIRSLSGNPTASTVAAIQAALAAERLRKKPNTKALPAFRVIDPVMGSAWYVRFNDGEWAVEYVHRSSGESGRLTSSGGFKRRLTARETSAVSRAIEIASEKETKEKNANRWTPIDLGLFRVALDVSFKAFLKELARRGTTNLAHRGISGEKYLLTRPVAVKS